MWVFLFGQPVTPAEIHWQIEESSACGDHESGTGIRISIFLHHFRQQPSRRRVLKLIAEVVTAQSSNKWIAPGESTWLLDLDKLAELIPDGKTRFKFLHDSVQLEPDVEIATQVEPDSGVHYSAGVIFFITPDIFGQRLQMTTIPTIIKDSLAQFQVDFPDPNKAAFIMMGFGETTAHDNIVKAIRSALEKHGIAGLRADDKEYHDDLLPNVRTYMHGCSFGIAVFERIESEKFNPNVGLEVGYMLAMGKPVCLLKDKTLPTLHTDLIGKLYKDFDVLHPERTIPKKIESWLNDKHLVGPRGVSTSTAESNKSSPARANSNYVPNEHGAKILLLYRFYGKTEIPEEDLYKHFPGERIEAEHAIEKLRADGFFEVGRIGDRGRYFELTFRGREYVIGLPKPPTE